MKVLTYKCGYNLEKIVEELQKGKLVVYPTDTIYGIAADIRNSEAVKKVYQTKQRSPQKALSVCFHDKKQLNNYVNTSSQVNDILSSLLPGPYTLLLEKNEKIDPIITGNTSIIGVRIPDNNVSYELTRKFPITSTSANISQNKTPDNINQIRQQLGDNIDYYIDTGKIANDKASTIIDLTKEKPQIIRKGLCDEKKLNNILKINLR